LGKTIRALTLFAICALTLLGSAAYGQEKDGDHHRGIVQDWSGHHVAYARFGPLKSLLAAQEDPRAIDAWQAAFRKDWNRWKHQGPRTVTTEHRDWSIGLGTGTTAASMYPAKYNFSPTATPDCTNDYVVFPVNVAGTTGQPNIVAFNNLYSGGTGVPPTAGAGICNRTPVTFVDTGVAATTLWSYAIQGITGGGSVLTSPSLSIDGAKVAFVETLSGNPAHFHVLAWKSGDGKASNLQSVTSPKVISSFTSNAPTEGSGTVTDLALGTTTDTLSSPFVDFEHDVAYVGNDTGTLYRVKDVFCTVDSSCTGGTPPAPSLDTTWGSGGSVSVCSGKLSGAVRDGVTGNIFVGCSDGKLYGFNSTGTSLLAGGLAVGDGTAIGGVVDPPMIDAVNGFVYAASIVSGTEVVVQASTTNLGSVVTADLGTGATTQMHDPDFNDAYFSSGTSSNWLLYEMGLNAGGTEIALYGIGFGAGHVMTSGTPADEFVVTGSEPAEFSPVTEFLNGSTDQLFVSGLLNSTNFLEFTITTFPTGITAFASEGTGGTSGIIIDNDSSETQASSMYFGTLGGTNTAVKLTQNGLD
jgi:hypothetical protein